MLDFIKKIIEFLLPVAATVLMEHLINHKKKDFAFDIKNQLLVNVYAPLHKLYYNYYYDSVYNNQLDNTSNHLIDKTREIISENYALVPEPIIVAFENFRTNLNAESFKTFISLIDTNYNLVKKELGYSSSSIFKNFKDLNTKQKYQLLKFYFYKTIPIVTIFLYINLMVLIFFSKDIIQFAKNQNMLPFMRIYFIASFILLFLAWTLTLFNNNKVS